MEKKENLKNPALDRSKEDWGVDSFPGDESANKGKQRIIHDKESRRRQEEEHRRASEYEWKKKHYGR